MPSPRVCCLFVAVLTTTGAAYAESTTNAADAQKPITPSQEVRTDDLALGKPTPTTPRPAVGPQQPVSDPAGSTSIVAPEFAQSAPIKAQPASGSTSPTATVLQAPEPVEGEVLPKRLPYQGEAAMPGYVLEEQRRTWLLVVGGGLFGVGYVIGLGVAGDQNFSNGLGFAAIPVVGPWIALNAHEDVCCDTDEGLAASGVIQDIGAILLGIGLASTRQVWMRSDLAWSVTPLVGQERNGLLLRGTF